MDKKQVEDFILSLPNTKLEYPYGKQVAIYVVGGKMFALVDKGYKPLRLSLRSDAQLAQLLRTKYETVLPGNRLDQKKWNTFLLTGQLSWPEIQDLIQHSYGLVATD